MNRAIAEPGFLQRLRRAVEQSGLVADVAALDDPSQHFPVWSDLAQVALEYLRQNSPQVGSRAAEELQALAGPAEYELLIQGRGYTYLHVVHFLYEFAKHHGEGEDSFYISARVGEAGGGLQAETNPDLLALMRLLATALPFGEDGDNLQEMARTLGELFLDKVFPSHLFRLDFAPQGDGRLVASLQYADSSAVRDYLAVYGLEGDMGAFFLNAALQIEGTILVGLKKMAHDFERTTSIEVPIEERGEQERREIVHNCSCAWGIAWTPDIRLRRLETREQILDQVGVVNRALNRRDLQYFQERVKTLEMRVRALEEGSRFHLLIGHSDRMRQVFQLIQQVAETELTVLIRGETGTGKELVARAIHESSARSDKAFVAVNCAAFSENLLESELFGHEKGAFTGADREKPGRFELADGGTLFLDEAGDIPLTTQVKLLRILETRSFERVGGIRSIEVDVRFIAATNQDVEALIEEGQFREDFFFRLNGMPLFLPALREHTEDIPELANHFVERCCQRAGKPAKGLARGAIRRLLQHAWPGNIRELQNVVERAVAVYARGDTITEIDISQALGIAAPRPQKKDAGLNLRQLEVLKQLVRLGEACRVEILVEDVGARMEGAGLSKRTLQNDLRKLDELGYVEWIKHGSARHYTISDEGAKLVEGA